MQQKIEQGGQFHTDALPPAPADEDLEPIFTEAVPTLNLAPQIQPDLDDNAFQNLNRLPRPTGCHKIVSAEDRSTVGTRYTGV